MAQFIYRLGNVYPMKRVRKHRGQRLSNLGIALEQNYIAVLHGEGS
jgi:hypothetical protein